MASNLDEINRKNVAFFLPHLGPGGLTHTLLTLAGGLVSYGFNVTLITLDKKDPEYITDKISRKISIHRLKSKRIITSILPLFFLIKKVNPDVIITGGPLNNSLVALIKHLAGIKAKTILTEHSLPSVDIKLNEKKLMDKVIPFFVKQCYPLSNKIVAVSEVVAKDLANYANISVEDIDVIYNPVVGNDLIEKSFIPVKHKWLNFKENNIILFVGRLEVVKNLPLLVEALEKARKKEDVKLIIVGNGTEKEKLQAFINDYNLKEHVDFVGYSSNPYAFMRQAKALILCSLWEGLPTVLIESMACGTNIIATNNLEGAGEILENGKYGYFVEGSSESLANAIIQAVRSDIDSKVLETKSQEFSIEKSVEAYINLF